jgi:hypothetical protein
VAYGLNYDSRTVLALVQAVLALMRALNLFEIGIDLASQGLIFIPLMGFITVARAGLVAGIALLYILFAYGELMQKSWAWWCGLGGVLLNLLLVLTAVTQGEALAHSLPWAVVPLILLSYLLIPARRRPVKS